MIFCIFRFDKIPNNCNKFELQYYNYHSPIEAARYVFIMVDLIRPFCRGFPSHEQETPLRAQYGLLAVDLLVRMVTTTASPRVTL